MLDRRWRRTLDTPPTGSFASITSMEWIDAAVPASSAWPMCFVMADAGARCWGVADAQRGVAVGRGANGLAWTAVSDDRNVIWRESRWGRLVIVRDRQDGGEPPQIGFGRPIVPSSGRTAVCGWRREASMGPVCAARPRSRLDRGIGCPPGFLARGNDISRGTVICVASGARFGPDVSAGDDPASRSPRARRHDCGRGQRAGQRRPAERISTDRSGGTRRRRRAAEAAPRLRSGNDCRRQRRLSH